MVELLTIIATSMSIEYIYMFIKICGRTYSFVEISKKIQYYDDIKLLVDLMDSKNKKITVDYIWER